MRPPSRKSTRITTATTTALVPAGQNGHLGRCIIGKGAVGSITFQRPSGGAVLMLFDTVAAYNHSIDLDLGTLGVEAVTVGTPDITVIYE